MNAARWLQALYDEIDSLGRFPERFPSAREREYLEEDLRQLVYEFPSANPRSCYPPRTPRRHPFRHRLPGLDEDDPSHSGERRSQRQRQMFRICQASRDVSTVSCPCERNETPTLSGRPG